MAKNMNKVATAPERVVVVGAGGFVGSAIVVALQHRSYSVYPLGSSDIDLLADSAGQQLRDRLQPHDTVIFVSAKAPVKDYAMFQQNILMVKNALDGLVGHSLAQLLYISSDAVYSDSPSPLTETSVTAPDNLHGQMHVAREMMLQATLADVPFATLRPTLIYGAGDPHNGYGPNRFRRLILNDAPIALFGNGEERRDHVDVRDVSELAVRMVEHRTIGVLNAVTGKVTSFRELAELTFRFSDGDTRIENQPRSGPMPHNGYRPFNPAEVMRVFPDFRFTDLESGLRDAFNEAASVRVN
jgi:UDP-glucose 4-epimerase